MFPRGSFFFVSTEIAGSSLRCRAFTRRAIVFKLGITVRMLFAFKGLPVSPAQEVCRAVSNLKCNRGWKNEPRKLL